MSADCVRCVVACADGNVYVYNLRSAELLFTFSGAERTGRVADMRLSADDRFIFSAAGVSNCSVSRRCVKLFLLRSLRRNSATTATTTIIKARFLSTLLRRFSLHQSGAGFTVH